jgi:hypothetical protein
MSSSVYQVDDWAADKVVAFASAEADELERMARSRDLRGTDNARSRRIMRERAHQLRMVVAGLNTGEGVTRRAAVTR